MTNPQPTLYTTGKNQKCFLKAQEQQGCPLSPLIFNIELEVLATEVRQEENN